MSARNSNRFIQVASVVVPALCVLGSQFIGGAPSSAHADDIGEYTPPSQYMSFSYTPRPHESVTIQSISSPFYFDSIDPYVEAPQIDEPLEPRPRSTSPQELPGVRVTSILPHPKNPLAIIDGKPRRVGDVMDSGWTVLSINGDDFTVTLRHKTGKEIRERMKKN